MLDPQSRGASSCVSWETAQGPGHSIRHQHWGQRLGRQLGCSRNRLGWVKSLKSLCCGSGLRAEPLRLQSIASFSVKPFPGQSSGKSPLLVHSWRLAAPSASQQAATRLPKTHSFPLLPPVEAIQGVGSTGLDMLAAAARGRAEHTTGQHQEFLPSLFIIAVHHCGQSPC